MADRSLWLAIKALIDSDKNIAAIRQEMTHLEHTIKQDHAQIANRGSLITQKKQILFDEKKNINLKELQVNELKEKEERKRTLLDKMSAQKEYKALERELETMARQRAALEEVVMQQWFTLDAIKSELDEMEKTKEAFIEQLTCDVATKEKRASELQEKLLGAEQEQLNVRQQVPPEWIKQYDRMKQSVQDPMVPAVNGSCSSCYYTIPHHELSKLKKEQLIICRSCYRFLFCETEQPTAA